MTISVSVRGDVDEPDLFAAPMPSTTVDSGTSVLGEPKASEDALPKRRSPETAAAAKSSVLAAMQLLDPDEAEAVAVVAPAPMVARTPEIAKRPMSAEPVMRPNGQLYYPRMLGTSSDVDTLRALRHAGLHVLLYGPPGTGKTSLLEAAFGEDLLTFAGHGDAQTDELMGTWRPAPNDSNTAYEWLDGVLPQAMDEGKVLLVDDATLTPSGVLAKLYPAMDGRQELGMKEHDPRRIVKAKKGFLIVAAHNPGVPGAVLSEALASRFSVHIEVSTDFELAKQIGVDARMVKLGVKLNKYRREGQVTWAPQMRELLAFKGVAEVLGMEAALANMVNLAPEHERDSVLQMARTWMADLAPFALGERA